MADVELDHWICKNVGLSDRELTPDDLFNIILYFFPEAEFCKDPEIIKTTGSAYVKLKTSDSKDRAILIEDPSIERVSQALYMIVISIVKSVIEKRKEVQIMRYL
jgi:hypothetical protein